MGRRKLMLFSAIGMSTTMCLLAGTASVAKENSSAAVSRMALPVVADLKSNDAVFL